MKIQSFNITTNRIILNISRNSITFTTIIQEIIIVVIIADEGLEPSTLGNEPSIMPFH